MIVLTYLFLGSNIFTLKMSLLILQVVLLDLENFQLGLKFLHLHVEIFFLCLFRSVSESLLHLGVGGRWGYEGGHYLLIINLI